MPDKKRHDTILKINYGAENEIISVYKLKKPTILTPSQCLIPIWSLVLFLLYFIAILIVLAASLYLNFNKRPGFYSESCFDRSCLKGLNMKCINNQCLCASNEYYLKGCQTKKTYLEKCHGNVSYCSDNKNLSCLDGVCKCHNMAFWNGNLCTMKSNYSGACKSNDGCFTDSQIVCDLKYKKCLCSSDRFWDGLVCALKRTNNESCSNANQCKITENLSCINQTCTCSIKEYWDSNARKCVDKNYSYGKYWCNDDTDCDNTKNLICNNGSKNCTCPTKSAIGMCDCQREFNNEYYWNGSSCVIAKSYNIACTNSSYTNFECQTITQETICNITNGQHKCSCQFLKYFNNVANKCLNQVSYNETCINDSACLNVFGLICSGGKCACPSTHYWDNIKCAVKKSYGTSCNSSLQCNDTAGLICPLTTGTCNCPLNSSTIFCDCPTGKYFDNITNMCTPWKNENMTCIANYQCNKTANQICNSGKCTCNISSGKCCAGNQIFHANSSTCVSELTLIVCDGWTLNIACNNGYKINILSASYGRNETTSCTPCFTCAKNCYYNSINIVAPIFNNFTSKSSPLSYLMVNVDPCPGTVKYFEVKYKCI